MECLGNGRLGIKRSASQGGLPVSFLKRNSFKCKFEISLMFILASFSQIAWARMRPCTDGTHNFYPACEIVLGNSNLYAHLMAVRVASDLLIRDIVGLMCLCALCVPVCLFVLLLQKKDACRETVV